jgi:hypothetical protein
MKMLIQLIVILWYIALFPREWQEGAPIVFLILGIFVYALTEVFLSTPKQTE